MIVLQHFDWFRSIGAWYFAIGTLLALVGSTVPGTAWGQSYQESRQLPLPEEFKDSRAVSKMRQEKNNAVRDGVQTGQNKAILDSFYLRFAFPALTREEYAPIASALRLELVRDMDRADAATRDHLATIAYRGGTGLLRDPRFHPAAHVNAVLLLGELNQQEGSGTSRAPVPDPRITKILVELLKSDQHAEPVHAAILPMLERHVRLRSVAKGAAALSNEEREQIRTVVLGIANQSEVPPQRSIEAHEWIRTQAIEILATLRAPDPAGEVAKSLEAIAADPKAGVDVRGAAIEALGALDPTTWQPDPTKFVANVAHLLVDVLSSEVGQLMGGRRQGGFRQGDMPGELELDDTGLADPATKDCRRRLLPRLARLERGLNGDSRTGRAGIVAAMGAGPFESVLASLAKSNEVAVNLESTSDEMAYQFSEIVDSLEEEFPDPTRPRSGRRGRFR